MRGSADGLDFEVSTFVATVGKQTRDSNLLVADVRHPMIPITSQADGAPEPRQRENFPPRVESC